MRAATGGVDDREFQQSGGRVFRARGDACRNYRIERTGEKLLHESIRRVVAASGLAGISVAAAFVGDSKEAKLPSWSFDGRYQLEEALINGAEFLGSMFR